MEERFDSRLISITSLPYEVVSIIINNLNIYDIVAFSSTCKFYRSLILEDNILWRKKSFFVLPRLSHDVQENNTCNNWFKKVKDFYLLKINIYEELEKLSSKYYWYDSPVTLSDVKDFFKMALSSSFNYFYVINILQELIKKSDRLLNNNIAAPPYTMTDIYYAKVVLRHLIQMYLTVKYVKLNVENGLYPEVVVNFFLQWVDCQNWHPDENITDKIDELAKKVQVVLNKQQPHLVSYSIADRLRSKVLRERDILEAISQVIFSHNLYVLLHVTNMDTLNISKASKTRCASMVMIAAIYHAVARRFDVKCEVVAFTNHLFLEWRDRSRPEPAVYIIDLNSGKISPKRICPYTSANRVYSYFPDTFLQYIYIAFIVSVGQMKTWYSQNAHHLIDFLRTDSFCNDDRIPYNNLYSHILSHHDKTLSLLLDITYFQKEQLDMFQDLVDMNAPVRHVKKDLVVKKRVNVKYAVGMLCYHKVFEYICIIIDWDLSYNVQFINRKETGANLKYGIKQPFYYVFAVNQSSSYVAQENLIELNQGSRLYHLEDEIAQQFTHFNGFAYIPNKEKIKEYPEDKDAIDAFQRRCQLISYRPQIQPQVRFY